MVERSCIWLVPKKSVAFTFLFYLPYKNEIQRSSLILCLVMEIMYLFAHTVCTFDDSVALSGKHVVLCVTGGICFETHVHNL